MNKILSVLAITLALPGLYAMSETQQELIRLIEEEFQNPTSDRTSLNRAEYALVAGTATAGSLVIADRLLERAQTRDPFAALTMVGSAARTGLTAGITIATVWTLSKLWVTFRQGLETPFVKEVESLKKGHEEFKKSVLRHQHEYEQLTDRLVERRIKEVEAGLKALMGGWLAHIDSEHQALLDSLKTQKNNFGKLRQNLTGSQQEELDKLLAQTDAAITKLEEMPNAHEAVLNKHTHGKQGAVAFFRKIFNRKQN